MNERARQVFLPQELHQGALRRLHAGGDKGDASAVEEDGLAMVGVVFCVETAGPGGGGPVAVGAADGEEFRDAEFCVDVVGEGAEVAVCAEKAEQAAAGSLVGGGEVGGQGTVGSGSGEEPFEGDAGVEGEEPAEADGEAAVALERGVVDGDAVVGKVLLQAALAGGDVFFAGGKGLVEEGVVEGGFEVGEPGTETQADEEGAGPEGSVVGEFFRRGSAAEGRGAGALFAEALAAAEFAEEQASGVGGEESREGNRGDREGGGDGDDAVVGEVRDEFAGSHGGVGGFFEDGFEKRHGARVGGKGWKVKDFP
jgi:hypothetical protein